MNDERDGWCGALRSLGVEKERQAWEAYGYWYDVDKYFRKGSGNVSGSLFVVPAPLDQWKPPRLRSCRSV
jgi:hypothetical protein